MRILYDHQVFTWQQYGGISRYFYELIKRVAATPGFDVALFLGLSVNRYGLEQHASSFSRFWGFRRPAIPKTNKIFSGVNGVLFPSFLRQADPDVYHATYYTTQWGTFRGSRIITVYDMIHERFPGVHPWHDRTARNKRRAVERADGIICISEATKRDVMDILGIPSDRIVVTYLGNSLKADDYGHFESPAPYILYVGQREGYKNFDLLMQAVARSGQLLRNFRIVCFGGGPLNGREQLRAVSLKIADRVQQISGTDAMLANLYKYAAVYVCPSFYEGFGIPTLEAMQLGCPVLVSNRSSLPEVAGDAGRYFDPDDVDDLSNKLEQVLGDDSLRNRMITLGLAQARRFSWDRCAQETLAFYRTYGS